MSEGKSFNIHGDDYDRLTARSNVSILTQQIGLFSGYQWHKAMHQTSGLWDTVVR